MRKRICLLAALMLLCAVFTSVAAQESAADASLAYINPKTGFRAVLLDDIDLLTDGEEAMLMLSMKSLTESTNIAFWSTRSASSQSAAIQNAERKHIELFGRGVNGLVFMIDMSARYMFLDTEGWAQVMIPKSTAEIITNNVRTDMTADRYYKASLSVMKQIQAKAEGNSIPEPMRYLSAAAIGIMGGLLFALLLTVSLRKSVTETYSKETVRATIGLIGDLSLLRPNEYTVKEEKRYSPPSSDSGGSSCSSCSGGGSSCSSCGGGSSCSSCGGGSSF